MKTEAVRENSFAFTFSPRPRVAHHFHRSSSLILLEENDGLGKFFLQIAPRSKPSSAGP